jgi:hypothetical protein
MKTLILRMRLVLATTKLCLRITIAVGDSISREIPMHISSSRNQYTIRYVERY